MTERGRIVIRNLSQTTCVAILLITLCLLVGEPARASGVPSTWGEVCQGLRLRVEVDEAVVRDSSFKIGLELFATRDSALNASHFTTKIDDARITLRVFEDATGKSRRFEQKFGSKHFPEIDIAIDSIADSIRLGAVRYRPFALDWPVTDHAWGQLELFIPNNDSENWSGVLVSAPFDFTIEEPDVETEEFSFVVPKGLVLVEGPRISFDSISVDTITVRSRRGYHRVASTRCSGAESAGVLAAKINDLGETELPFLPYLPMWQPLPGSGLFVDGQTTIELDVDLYEAQSIPDFHLGIHFSGPHRILWQRTFGLKITKDQLLALTPDGDEQIDYRTCLVPHRVRLEGDKLLSFRKGDASPQELQLKKGNAIGYSVLVNNQNVGCFEGYPQSPLTKLPNRPSCDSPVEVMLRIFQYERGMLQGEHDRLCRTFQTLWLAKCTIERDSGAFDLKVSDDFGPRRSGWRRWRQCRIPNSLSLTSNGRVEFDSTDMQVIDFRPWSDYLPLIRITVDVQQPELVSTQLCNPIAVWHPANEKDTSVEIKIDIIVSEPPDLPDAATSRAIWSRSYQLHVPESMIGVTGVYAQ
jgi:hypothetical protein